MDGIAKVLGVVVWPALLGFVIWLFKAPLGACLNVLADRLRGSGGAPS